MPSVPTAPTFTDAVLTSSELNALRDAINFNLRRPVVLMRQIVVQTLTNGVFTALTFTAEDVDNVSGHSTSVNTSRYTAQYPGYVWVGGGPNFAASATGGRGSRWTVNGVDVSGSEVMLPGLAGLNLGLPAKAMPVYMAQGDYLELFAWQNSGGNLDTVVTAAAQPSLAAVWVSTGETP